MRLEFVKIEEANAVVNQLIEHHPNAIFVTDHNFKIDFHNRAFQKLTRREKHEIYGKEFCETLGCTYRGNAVSPDKNICKNCRIRELLSGSNISELDIIRDFKIHNEVVTKHFFIQSQHIIMNNKKMNIVILEDRTYKH